MHKVITVTGLACLALALRVGAQAQPTPPQAPANPSPEWAYGVPNTPVERPAGERPAPDTSLKHIPGTTKAFTVQQIRDFWDVADWFPDEHPVMPSIVVHGRQPHVRGCAMCHMPSGKGRPENAPVSALPASYIVQQLQDFKNGLRASADPRKPNTAQMIEAARDMTDEEMKDAANYFSSLKWMPWITVKETATVPRTRIAGNVFFPLPGAATEPIGNRIIETPEDAERFELRDPHSGFIAYVPPGSIAKGGVLASSGGGKTTPCRFCHGPDLMGLGPVPGIAGRSPSYLMRQMWDIHEGARHGEWTALMKPVVQDLSHEDMLNLAAYLAAAGPAPTK